MHGVQSYVWILHLKYKPRRKVDPPRKGRPGVDHWDPRIWHLERSAAKPEQAMRIKCLSGPGEQPVGQVALSSAGLFRRSGRRSGNEGRGEANVAGGVALMLK
jgi:hypothetical protein